MSTFFSEYGLTLLWAAALVTLLAVEAGTTNLVSIWFALGALIALIVSLFTPSFAVQMMVFAVVSLLALVLTKPLVRKMRIRKPASSLGLERNLGRQATALTELVPGQHGRVRLDGVDWIAISNVPVSKGEACIVTGVDSTTLTVAPLAQ